MLLALKVISRNNPRQSGIITVDRDQAIREIGTDQCNLPRTDVIKFVSSLGTDWTTVPFDLLNKYNQQNFIIKVRVIG
jgi:hypothetical protein